LICIPTRRPVSHLAIIASVAVLLAACSSISETFLPKPIDYKSTNTLPPLEIPPDLTIPGTDDRFVVPDSGGRGAASASAYANDRGAKKDPAKAGVLPTPPKARIERSGLQRWLVVEADPERVWPTIRQFWQEQGFVLTVESPTTGVLETDWAENRAKLPMDFIRKTLGKVLDSIYSTGERDKFRTRLERGGDNLTEIYVSHRGMVEVVDKRSSNALKDGSTDGTVWQPRAPDPDLEAEFLQRLLVRFGVEDSAARAQLAKGAGGPEKARLVKTAEGVTLTVDERFDRTWRRVGLALDRVGFTVEDRDRANGQYFVRYADPDADMKKGGILDRLAFWRNKDNPKQSMSYRIQLLETGGSTTEVRVVSEKTEGESDRSRSEIASRILTLLHGQLR
jgi:outer membrane protein assembly factor BamC